MHCFPVAAIGRVMCVDHGHGDSPSQTSAGSSRRGFLRNSALAGAGAAALGTVGVGARSASAAELTSSGKPASTGSWDPDPNSLQFTLAVMPDTQFLYWGTQNSINSA